VVQHGHRGESVEYTGTPIELLLSFLIAIGILVPIYGLIFVGTLELGMISQFSSLLGLTVFALFRKFASYCARRYRLTRTVLRGGRFHQTGSGFLYAIRATLWSIANMVTLGLTYPWAAANLDRCKMRHTFYGGVGGAFAGSGGQLFLRGIPIWLAIISPMRWRRVRRQGARLARNCLCNVPGQTPSDPRRIAQDDEL
jgi:uncharacterized membrane protein YjgN (DUF898 family)